MKLTIEKTDKFYTCGKNPVCIGRWFQAWLIVGELRLEIGRSFYDYNDCLSNANEIVKEFSKEKVALVHDGIYDLHP